MAPEIAQRNYEGRKVDIFAAGVLLFIMYKGSPPFEATTSQDPFYKLIINKKYNDFWKYHSKRMPKNFFSE